MITRRTLVTHTAAASAALLPGATTATPESAPEPLSAVEAVRLYLTTDRDYELNLDISFHLSLPETPAHLTALAAHPAPDGIYRRFNWGEGRPSSIEGAFHLYGNHWNGKADATSRSGGLRDWNDHLYGEDDEILVAHKGLAGEIDLLTQFRRLLQLPE